jgi:hypothetical protein
MTTPTLSEWCEMIEKTLEVKTVEDLYVHCKAYRKARECCIVPACCCPCTCWSCVWRVLCCPIQVCRYGCDPDGDACCRSNCCTNFTDNYVESFIKDTPRKMELPYLDEVIDAHALAQAHHNSSGIVNLCDDDKELIRETLALVEARFANIDGKRKYTDLDFGICEIVMRSIGRYTDTVPAFVGLRLWNVRELRGIPKSKNLKL